MYRTAAVTPTNTLTHNDYNDYIIRNKHAGVANAVSIVMYELWMRHTTV